MWNEIASFILANLAWIIPAGVVILALIVFLIMFLAKKGKKKKKPKLASQSEYLSCLGGAENILNKAIRGSRIVIEFADPEKVDAKKILDLGIDTYIFSSSKLTLVCKEDAQQVYDQIFS